MPTYQYACTVCGHSLEAVQAFSDAPLTVCPECDGRLRKVFSSVGVVFKGSGFYRTDSRAGASSGEGSGTAKSETGTSSAASSSGSASGTSGGTGSTGGSTAATSSGSTSSGAKPAAAATS